LIKETDVSVGFALLGFSFGAVRRPSAQYVFTDDQLSGAAWTDSRMIGRDHGWTDFSIRSEFEIHPSAGSALRSEAS
jgi:hypothetical protein